jgi:predicted TIM-barrel fold metal-dependent hydrolase
MRYDRSQCCASRPACGSANAAQWPSRTVRLLVPYPAGGNVDGAARLIANKLGEVLDQAFIIENKAGAGGLIAGEMVVGVRGARFSFRKEFGAVLSDKDFARAIARTRELGWYAKIQPEKDGIVSSVDKFGALDVPVLVDHMARPDPARGKDDPNLQKMLELLSKGNFWVMLSLGEKTSKAGPPWDDVIPIARAYIEAAPDRCVWASDWPHPVSVVQPPNDADLLELLYRYAPDAEERRRILVSNPARLFGFES